MRPSFAGQGTADQRTKLTRRQPDVQVEEMLANGFLLP
jgi:hypothetical protein